MPRRNLTSYGRIELKKPTLLPHSRLYHLPPIGIGTAFIESLTGYIARLAQAHNVTTLTLVAKEIGPLLNKRHAVNERGNFKIFQRAMNGFGVTAQDFVKILEKLTLRRDLSFTTMWFYKNVLSVKGLIRPTRAWCVECYQEWRCEENIVYEPLLWAVNVVTICPNHRRYLSIVCHHCNKQLLHLDSRSRPGYCSKCNRWLGVDKTNQADDNKDLSRDELDRQLWFVNEICELIILSQTRRSPPQARRVSDALSYYIKEFSHGSINKFSLLLPFTSDAVRWWLRGKVTPSLESLLCVCFHLQIRSTDFLFRKVLLSDTNTADTFFSKVEAPRIGIDGPMHADWQKIERYLERAAKIYPPIPLNKLARKIGCARDTLIRHLPVISKRIIEQHFAYYRNPFDHSKALEELNKALVENPPPSLQTVYRRLGFRGSGGHVLEKYFPELCRAIKQRYAEFRKKPFNYDGVKAEIQRALNEWPPPSFTIVAKRTEYARSTLIGKFLELSKQVSERYKVYNKTLQVENKKALEEQIRNTCTMLIAQGIYPTLTKIRAHLTVPASGHTIEKMIRDIQCELGIK